MSYYAISLGMRILERNKRSDQAVILIQSDSGIHSYYFRENDMKSWYWIILQSANPKIQIEKNSYSYAKSVMAMFSPAKDDKIARVSENIALTREVHTNFCFTSRSRF